MTEQDEKQEAWRYCHGTPTYKKITNAISNSIILHLQTFLDNDFVLRIKINNLFRDFQMFNDLLT